MQLGTRWPVGGHPTKTLPEVLGLAIEAVEGDLRQAGVDASAWNWTLTYLESRPVLTLDDGTTVTYDPTEDAATITQPQGAVSDDDDWDED